MSRKKLYYFILSGLNESLAFSELKALLDTYNVKNYRSYLHSKLALIESNELSLEIVKKIVIRSGMIKEGGYALKIVDNMKLEDLMDTVENLTNSFKWINYWIKIINVKGLSSSTQLEKIRDHIRSIDPRMMPRSNNVISMISIEGFYIVGLRLATIPTREFYERRPSIRPFFRSIALPVYLSRLLINLSRVKEGMTFLDPFCGTGSILIEAALMGLRTIGLDLNWEMARGSIKNLRSYELKIPFTVAGDALNLPLPDSSVDAIATDPPYGRAASTYGEKVKEVYNGFLREAYRVLRDKRYLVFMAPSWLAKHVEKLLCRYGFILCRKHHMYVHGGLTRIIYVVYKA